MTTIIENSLTSVIASQIRKNLPGTLTEMREEALASFQKTGMPGHKTEEYRHTPMTRLIEKNFDISVQNKPTDFVPVDFQIPGLDGDVIVLVNGIFSKTHSKIVSPGNVLEIASLASSITKPEVLERLAKIADYNVDPFAAWNTAAWQDGVYIKVADNAVIGKPITIYNILDLREGQAIVHARALVIAGKNSEVSIVEKLDSVGKANGFSTQITEIAVAENASIHAYFIQNDSGNRYHFAMTQIHQTNASRVNTYTFTLDGKLVRNNLQLSLDGQGIESHMYGLYSIGKDTLADNHTIVDHRQPNSFSNELYKGIMDEKSKGVFNGKIYVRPNAQKTNAFQTNRNILLTDQATVNTKPQLEIWADDVKCSHGCTTGQLDEEALFYLRSRGISKETARAMMLYAFAEEVIDNVKHPEIKSYLDDLISERLHKNF